MLSDADAMQPDTQRTEREAFFERLRTEPGFLLRHIRTLACAVFRRLRTMLAVWRSGTHQGRKIRPVWLDAATLDRKSTRLNSSHVEISYAVFCLKKKRTSGK